MKKTIVIAFGGNALLGDPGDANFTNQYDHLSKSIGHILDLKQAGWNIVIVHGNGPQVGFSLQRSEIAKSHVSPLSLDYAVAESQGSIGFMFQRAIGNELIRRNLNFQVVTLLTEVMVDSNDPAFQRPTKPVGGFMNEQEAQKMRAELGWEVMEDAGRGWRRCVASPKPFRILEHAVIRRLVEDGVIVIAGGGGGIAVCADAQGCMNSLEAVIDKDLTAALLATQLQADFLLIPTAVTKVALHFGRPEQQWLDQLSPEQAEAYIEQGEFGKGSMQPKIEALLTYVKHCPRGCGVITDPPSMLEALAGDNGTRIAGRLFQDEVRAK